MTDIATPSDESGFSRRRLLGGAAAAGGIAAASLALPPNVRKALASPLPSPRRLEDIKHVVLLMQENRSFDHYYGTLRGVRGFSDPHPARLPSGRPVFYQPDPSNPDGFLLPYRLNTTSTAAQAVPSLSHDWALSIRLSTAARWTTGCPRTSRRTAPPTARTRWATTPGKTSRSSTPWPTRSRSSTTTSAP